MPMDLGLEFKALRATEKQFKPAATSLRLGFWYRKDRGVHAPQS